MNISELKKCIHYEVIGCKRPFSAKSNCSRNKTQKITLFILVAHSKISFDKGGYRRKIAGKIERFILDKYNVTVPLTVNIGKGFDISYLNGVVIGHKVTIGENCSIKPG